MSHSVWHRNSYGKAGRQLHRLQKMLTMRWPDCILHHNYANDRPDPEIAVMLMLYEFCHTNKVFSLSLIRSKGSGQETPFGLFLSLASYLATQQSRSMRATLYSRLALLTIRNLIDYSSVLGLLQHEDTKSRIRVCRQRQPFLPNITTERKLVEAALDVCICGIDHNLRRRLDVEFYLYWPSYPI